MLKVLFSIAVAITLLAATGWHNTDPVQTWGWQEHSEYFFKMSALAGNNDLPLPSGYAMDQMTSQLITQR